MSVDVCVAIYYTAVVELMHYIDWYTLMDLKNNMMLGSYVIDAINDLPQFPRQILTGQYGACCMCRRGSGLRCRGAVRRPRTAAQHSGQDGVLF